MIMNSWKELSTESRLVKEQCVHIHLEQPNRWRVHVNVVLHICSIIWLCIYTVWFQSF